MVSIIYSTLTGNAEEIANMISSSLSMENEVFEMSNIDLDKVKESKCVILGTPTYGSGDPQDEWFDFDFNSLGLSGKKVAVFGLGDGSNYSDTFCNGMTYLYDKAKECGADMIDCSVSTQGYDFSESSADKDGNFIGLAIDVDNQSELSEERIKSWVSKIESKLS